MDGSQLFVLALVVLAIAIVKMGFRVVPQGEEHNVERFGKYFGTTLPADDCFKALAEAFFGTVVFRQENPPAKGRGNKK